MRRALLTTRGLGSGTIGNPAATGGAAWGSAGRLTVIPQNPAAGSGTMHTFNFAATTGGTIRALTGSYDSGTTQYTVRAVSAALTSVIGVNTFTSLSLTLAAGDLLAIWAPTGGAQGGYTATDAAYWATLTTVPVVGSAYTVSNVFAATVLAQGVY